MKFQATPAAAELAAYWNVPMISPASIGSEFDNKSIYKTLVRVSPLLVSDQTYVEFLIFRVYFSIKAIVANRFSTLIMEVQWVQLLFYYAGTIKSFKFLSFCFATFSCSLLRKTYKKDDSEGNIAYP